jgi:hypothetical protein
VWNCCWQIKKALRGVKVEVTHRGSMRRKYRISGLTNQATNELEYVFLAIAVLIFLWRWVLECTNWYTIGFGTCFYKATSLMCTVLRRFPVDENGTLKSVTDYFRETYGYTIRHPSLPCLQVGNSQRPNYLPMEVCKIVEGQRYSKRLNERQITALLKVTCQRPRDRERDILQVILSCLTWSWWSLEGPMVRLLSVPHFISSSFFFRQFFDRENPLLCLKPVLFGYLYCRQSATMHITKIHMLKNLESASAISLPKWRLESCQPQGFVFILWRSHAQLTCVIQMSYAYDAVCTWLLTDRWSCLCAAQISWYR